MVCECVACSLDGIYCCRLDCHARHSGSFRKRSSVVSHIRRRSPSFGALGFPSPLLPDFYCARPHLFLFGSPRGSLHSHIMALGPPFQCVCNLSTCSCYDITSMINSPFRFILDFTPHESQLLGHDSTRRRAANEDEADTTQPPGAPKTSVAGKRRFGIAVDQGFF